jgi:hypothetical protein
MIKAGSSVKHIPTGEKWFLVGVNRKKNEVCVAGYPPTIAMLSYCIEIDEGNGINEEELKYRNKEFGYNWD